MSFEQEQNPEPKKEAEQSPRVTDFSIEAILKNDSPSGELDLGFDWLKCSRYQPPKLPTERKERCKRRHYGRSARIPFSNHQVSALEAKFRQTQYLSSNEVIEICRMLDISEIRVKIWFQNRRARQRRERQAEIQKLISLGTYASSIAVPRTPPESNGSLWNPYS